MAYVILYVPKLNLKKKFILLRLASCLRLSVICLALLSFDKEKFGKRLKIVWY
jgi:hypothetical protein